MSAATHLSLYDRLKISSTASPLEIRKAYRGLAILYHPDKNGDPLAADQFRDITEAYEVLNDAEKRAKYDEMLLQETVRFRPLRSTENILNALFQHFGLVRNTRGYSYTYTVNNNKLANDEDYDADADADYDDSFKKNQKPSERNILLALELPLKDFYCGTRKQIQFLRRQLCVDCLGTGLKPNVQFFTCTECEGLGFYEETHRKEIGMGLLSICRKERHRCKKCAGTKRLAHNHDICTKCKQSGTTMTPHSVRIDLAPGETVDRQFLFTGKGHQLPWISKGVSANNNHPIQCGDVIVIVKDATVKVSPTDNSSGNCLSFKRLSCNHSNDLFTQCQISLTEMILGGVLQFIHVDGEQWKVEVKPMQFTILELPLLRIRGAGMPLPLSISISTADNDNNNREQADKKETREYGDLWIQLHPQFPAVSELQTVTASTTLEQLSPHPLLPNQGQKCLVLTRMVVAEQVSGTLYAEINSCIYK